MNQSDPLFDPWTAHSFFEPGVFSMSSVVYVVRSPLHALSPALFSGNGCEVVLSLEDPLLPGKVLQGTDELELKVGEKLSYDQLVAILLDTRKVVTL